MNRKEFMGIHKAIMETYSREKLCGIMETLKAAGYADYGCIYRDLESVDPKTVKSKEYGTFLLGVAREVLWFRFDA